MPLLKQSRQIFKIIQSQKDSAKFWIQNAPVQWDNEIPMFSVRIIVAAFGAKGVFRGEWNCNVSGELEPYWGSTIITSLNDSDSCNLSGTSGILHSVPTVHSLTLEFRSYQNKNMWPSTRTKLTTRPLSALPTSTSLLSWGLLWSSTVGAVKRPEAKHKAFLIQGARDWMFVFPPPIYMWKHNPQYDGVRMWELWEVISSRE